MVDLLPDLLVYHWGLLFLILALLDERTGEDYRRRQAEEDAHLRKTSHDEVLEVVDRDQREHQVFDIRN
jgi:hypothetical protein